MSLQHPESEFTVCISYLEIYNENGYDLLDPKHEAAKLEDLPCAHCCFSICMSICLSRVHCLYFISQKGGNV